jgi:ABC-type multidrug transport system ATPase subunit
VIASHNLDELERVADRVGIIDRGRLQHVAEIGHRATAARAIYRIVVAAPSPLVAEAFPGSEPVRQGRAEEVRTAPLDLGTLNDGLARLIAGGVQIVAAVPERSHLETAFRQAVGAEE